MRAFKIFLVVFAALVLRLPVAIIITATLTALITVIWYLLDSSGNYSELSRLFIAVSLPLAVVLLPAALVACLKSKFTLRSRLFSSLKTCAVVLVLFVAWNGFLLSLISSGDPDISSRAVEPSLIVDLIFHVLLLILCGVLALKWLPSGKTIAVHQGATSGVSIPVHSVQPAKRLVPTAPRPFTMKMFEYLIAAYVVALVAQFVIGYDLMHSSDQGANRAFAEAIVDSVVGDDPLRAVVSKSLLVDKAMYDMSRDGPATYIAIGVGWMIAIVVFTALVSRLFKKNIRYILAVLFCIQAVPTILQLFNFELFRVIDQTLLITMVNIGLVVIFAAALCFVFSRQSNAWFRSGQISCNGQLDYS
ncbi:MAG: hypothetical protein O3B21_15070 [Proteobacteria bacterium]|nr:hypothetical protein [Pseudomonadota bacterium]MDA1357704.1 hypothetical protein [Pseudomonadota bacterium]